MKQKRFVALLCVLSSVFMLSGCAMHVPVIILCCKRFIVLKRKCGRYYVVWNRYKGLSGDV